MDQPRFESAVALRDAGRAEDAIGEFRSMAAEASDPNEKAAMMLNEVRCYCNLSRLNEAERVLKEIRKLEPDDIVALLNADFAAACLEALRGKHEKALFKFDHILQEYVGLLQTSEYHDLCEDIRQRRACALADLIRHSEAVPLLKEAASFESLTAGQKQRIHLYLGRCYYALAEIDPAKEEFLRVIDFGLKNELEVQAQYNVAILYFNVGAFARSKYQLEMILQTYQSDIPGVPRKDIYQQLSRTCHYLGEEDDAKRYLTMAQESR